MQMERRGFIEKALAAGLGLATLTGQFKAYAKCLPSDQDISPPSAIGPDEIALPHFEKSNAFSLDQALLMRKSSRNYNKDKTLSKDDISRILWATNGVNRCDGKRTTPSALAMYPVEVLAAIPEGVYRYDPKAHLLAKVLGRDIRGEIPRQAGFKEAALILLYVVKKKIGISEQNNWADIEIGCMVQSTYLRAASMGLGSCVFALVNYEKVSGSLGLGDKKHLRIAQAVGPLRD